MRTIDYKIHIGRHRAMVEYQKKIAPFTPTIRDLLELWGVSSTCIVHNTLNRLVKIGLVVTRKHGSSVSYYAVEDTDAPLPQAD